MGCAFVMSECYGCKRTFIYNPVRVPSVRVNGVREPICRNCAEAANPKREKLGLPKIEILPDAYEPVDENELS